MKITVPVSITVDPQAWREEYGTDENAYEIRDQIGHWVREAAVETFAHLDCVTVAQSLTIPERWPTQQASRWTPGVKK